jgi:hypothetical protein
MMKNILATILAGLALASFSLNTSGQQSFSPEAYMQFLNQVQDYTASEILSDHPPKTDYFSSRQHPADLSGIPWFDSIHSRFQLTSDELDYLEQNFFMVSERLGSHDWASAFIDIYSNDLPLFLSTDFLLTTLHNSYDAILQTLEWQFLEPNLKDLLHAMYEEFPSLVNTYANDDRFHEILKDVDLYISVALSLAEGQEFAPQYDNQLKFQEVLAAVDAEQMASMTLFTDTKYRKLDFSQFTPRGHYNKEIYTHQGVITLENYFKAMMWLGRIDFLLTAPPENPWEPNWTVDELRRMQLGALLSNELVHNCGKIQNLKKHEEIISFLVGPDDNLNPKELEELRMKHLQHPADLFQEDSYKLFTEGLNASDDYGQKIMSNFFFVDPFSEDPGKLPVSFKLLGQKFLLDSYVFSEVVFDRIVFGGQKIWRPLPDPLDAMAALGNEDALALLEGEMETYKYAANMAGLNYLVEAYDEEFWEQSLYNTWLGALRSLNPPESTEGLPYFMQTTAWHQEKLNTQLTSWAQLRHDNILYGKQSYTGGTGCSYPLSYVEPYPEFYGRLQVFAENAASFFREVLDGEMLESKQRIIDYYISYAGILGNLEAIAQKELEGTKLGDAEISFLKTMINSYMASGPSITGWYNDLFFDAQKGLSWDYTVADVHTQPTDAAGAVVGHVLHVGNGKINLGVFLAENPCNPGQYMAFVGPVSSFHQKVTSNFERLTDQEWEEYFWSDFENYPDRPDWVSAYLLDHQGKALMEGRSLEGKMYTGTSDLPANQPQVYDYLLLFPNPAPEKAHIRFVLNQEEDFSLVVYDASGRMIHREESRILPAAEHHLELPAHSWEAGIYLVQVKIGQTYLSKELVVQ